MKKFATSLIIFVLSFFVFAAGNVSAMALTSEEGSVNVAKTEIINDDLFIAAQSAEIAGTINGDVFVGAQSVKITGVINGNLHVGTSSLDLSGKVKGNVYAGAQSIIVNGGSIGGSLIVGGATVNVDKTTLIGGSIMVGAGAVSIDSQVGRSVYAGAGSLTLGDNTKITKDLYYGVDSEGKANISEKAKILGSIHKSEVDTGSKNIEAFKSKSPAMLNGFKFGSNLISFIGALIIGFLYFKFFGKSFAENSKLVGSSFWKSLGIGFLVTIATVPAIIILLITIIGIPVAGVAIVVLTLYSYLAKIIVGSALGIWISAKFKWKTSFYGAFVIGLLTIYILKMIPFAGALVWMVVAWAGLGALTTRMFSKSE